MSGRRGSAPLRVAVVGLGWAGRNIWLQRLRAHRAYEVVALVEPDPVLRASVAREAGGTAVYASTDRLAADSVDLAIVAVPNHLHAPVAGRVLAAGIPVFLEKPLCLSSAEVDQLAAAEAAGGAVLLGGSAACYRADVTALRELTASLGEIRHAELFWRRARGVPAGAGWFTSRQLAGGGALVDLGWHLLDVARLLLGRQVFEQVVGAVSADFVNGRSFRAAWREDDPADGPGGDVEDTAHGFMVTADGLSVALRASWASHEALDSTVFRIEGSEGAAELRCTFGFSPNRVEGSSLTHTVGGVAGPAEAPAEPIGAEYDRQLDAVPALLTDPAGRGRAVEDARWAIDVIERIYASAALAQAGRPLSSVSR
ncbi:Gfo/Idh/MocA family protein [Amycolatopsis sp. WQ 127309]|uniref:Gfo/Idh/MocA family protein n=1 Tax=Amycolatopsis sp. WQ 127309 TaxID=2932773 RepID=UPI001FF28C76|nr:Gfo/Idh/MocA family oxidoreductase [Amycolatopsis sp. WQ 127309]UOZ02742.1 Gfo/Idh/MocA family oxidoreductase [Amycolatopsis sp. WQ 127309]